MNSTEMVEIGHTIVNALEVVRECGKRGTRGVILKRVSMLHQENGSAFLDFVLTGQVFECRDWSTRLTRVSRPPHFGFHVTKFAARTALKSIAWRQLDFG